MMSKPKLKVGVSVILVDPEGLVWVGRRAYEDEKAFSGYYQFPGGGAEPGESADLAAQRELLEEMGLLIDLDRFVFLGRKQVNVTGCSKRWGKCFTAYRYLVKLKAGEVPKNTEPKKNLWWNRFSLDYVRELKPFMPNNLEFLELIPDFLNKVDENKSTL